MRTRTIYDKAKELSVKAVQTECPRCRGFGATTADRGNACSLCRGMGTIWQAGSCYMPLYGRFMKDERYY
jgi:DnaJ-class molecular chaperone